MPWQSLFEWKNDAQMNSQLQYWNQVELLFLCNSEKDENSRLKFSRILSLISNQNNWNTSLLWQPKKQYRPFSLAGETAIMTHTESILTFDDVIDTCCPGKQVCGKKEAFVKYWQTYLSLLLSQQLKLVKMNCILWLLTTYQVSWNFVQYFRTYRQDNISSVFTFAVVTSYHNHLHIKMVASISQISKLWNVMITRSDIEKASTMFFPISSEVHELF